MRRDFLGRCHRLRVYDAGKAMASETLSFGFDCDFHLAINDLGALGIGFGTGKREP